MGVWFEVGVLVLLLFLILCIFELGRQIKVGLDLMIYWNLREELSKIERCLKDK